MGYMDYILAFVPLMPSILLLVNIHDAFILKIMVVSVLLSVIGFLLSNSLIPVVSGYTLKRGLCGKDLGKKGSADENKEVPEALGIVTGTIFLMIAIFSSLLLFHSSSNDMKNYQQQMVYNSALFSICFMIFLGFTDDTLELKWRYKLILPTIASFPLLTAYSGSTSIYIPQKLQSLFMSDHVIAPLGRIVSAIGIVVDTNANGAIIELGHYFYIYMSLLSVFCTNTINIYAGINGLECGQSYIIASSILFFKLYEIFVLQLRSSASQKLSASIVDIVMKSSENLLQVNENQILTIVMVVPFIGVMLSLLRSNWYPAKVFVGDTFCYFAGMTFAVLGIHGHFSKTLLLLFLPQIVNFIYSIPQLFKIIPCPRHRLPKINVQSKLLSYSTFPCKASEHALYKLHINDTECPNCTLICLVLRCTGPLHEKTLCIVLLSIQILSSILAFLLRYHILENK